MAGTAEERTWVERWGAAGTALDEQRRRELRDMTPGQALAASDALLSIGATAYRPPAREATSGLVEQQALFQKLARR